MCKQRVCVSRVGWRGAMGVWGGELMSEPSWRRSESDTEKRTVETGRKGIKWILMQRKQKLKDWMTDLSLSRCFF